MGRQSWHARACGEAADTKMPKRFFDGVPALSPRRSRFAYFRLRHTQPSVQRCAVRHIPSVCGSATGDGRLQGAAAFGFVVQARSVRVVALGSYTRVTSRPDHRPARHLLGMPKCSDWQHLVPEC